MRRGWVYLRGFPEVPFGKKGKVRRTGPKAIPEYVKEIHIRTGKFPADFWTLFLFSETLEIASIQAIACLQFQLDGEGEVIWEFVDLDYDYRRITPEEIKALLPLTEGHLALFNRHQIEDLWQWAFELERDESAHLARVRFLPDDLRPKLREYLESRGEREKGLLPRRRQVYDWITRREFPEAGVSRPGVRGVSFLPLVRGVPALQVKGVPMSRLIRP